MKLWHLKNHYVYEANGQKAKTFLHGQLTNHILDLKDNAANYNLLLTLKGKVQADLYVYQSQGKIYLSFDASLEGVLMSHLKKLALLSGVSFQKIEDANLFHIFGNLNQNDSFENTFCIRTDRFGTAGYDVFIKKNLSKDDFEIVSADEIQKIRIQAGVAQMNLDFDDKNLPQEARLDSALHFDKGCYLGQEVIARLHYRGHVNRILVPFTVEAQIEKTEDDQKIYNADEKAVGTITSFISDDEKTYALGYIPYKVFQNPIPLFWKNHRIHLNNVSTSK